MKIVKLPKENFEKFIESLNSFGEIHAPVKRDDSAVIFNQVRDLSKIEIYYTRTILPVKKYFLKPVDTMFNFSVGKGYEMSDEESHNRKIIFGLHSCDIHSLKILDLVFGGKYVDNYYFSRRNNTAIIGISCIPDEFCFCRSTNTDFVDTCFDLFLSDIDDSYLVRVGTSLGDDMVGNINHLFKNIGKEDREIYKKKSREKIGSFRSKIQLQDMPEIMDLEYNSEIWQKLGDECLSCGICSMVCPTCYCYSVFDELDLDIQNGRRKRRWDSCLFKSYAQVAGGVNFRAQRSSRIKNRYFHKERSFVTQYGRSSCVGCGRCRVLCPAKIDIVKNINELRSETYG